MGMIRNLLALIGLIAVVGGAYLASEWMPEYQAFKKLDPGASDIYAELWSNLKESGITAEATVWKFPLEEDVSVDDAEEAMRSVANEYNIKNVGELFVSDQVAGMTGEKQRYLKIFQFCNPIIAMEMIDYSDAFSAYLPCRIALVEDKNGEHVLYALNMDMMISGGTTLPPELLDKALHIKNSIRTIMERGAAGDF